MKFKFFRFVVLHGWVRLKSFHWLILRILQESFVKLRGFPSEVRCCSIVEAYHIGGQWGKWGRFFFKGGTCECLDLRFVWFTLANFRIVLVFFSLNLEKGHVETPLGLFWGQVETLLLWEGYLRQGSLHWTSKIRIAWRPQGAEVSHFWNDHKSS